MFGKMSAAGELPGSLKAKCEAAIEETAVTATWSSMPMQLQSQCPTSNTVDVLFCSVQQLAQYVILLADSSSTSCNQGADAAGGSHLR